MEQQEEIRLTEALALLQGVVFSCVDRKQFPYSKTQMNIFTVLAMEGVMSMKQLARYLSCSQEQATRALSPLADDGYVERRVDPENRTRVLVSLTEEGRRQLALWRRQLTGSLDAKLRLALTAEERDGLRIAAETIIPLLEKVRTADK